MNKRKTSAKVGVFICFIVGLCLILTGIFVPKLIKQRSFEYSEDYQLNKLYYEFDIETREKLDLNTGKVKIKVGGKEIKTFNIYYLADESDASEGEYEFVAFLFDDDASIFNEIIEIEIFDEAGNSLIFKPKTVGSNFALIPMTIVPIFFGLVFLIMGLFILFSKLSLVNAESALKTVQTVAEKTEQVKVKEEDRTITCKYCGLENDKENAKCEYCGGPLYRKK